MLREYREIYQQVTFLKAADQVLLPNLEVKSTVEQQPIHEKSREELASYSSPILEHSHVFAPHDEEFDMQDMDEDMRRAIELSKLEQ